MGSCYAYNYCLWHLKDLKDSDREEAKPNPEGTKCKASTPFLWGQELLSWNWQVTVYMDYCLLGKLTSPDVHNLNIVGCFCGWPPSSVPQEVKLGDQSLDSTSHYQCGSGTLNLTHIVAIRMPNGLRLTIYSCWPWHCRGIEIICQKLRVKPDVWLNSEVKVKCFTS